MQFLSDVYLRCPDCDGSAATAPRSARSAPRARLGKAMSIADVLELTVVMRAPVRRRPREVVRALQPLADVGLDYVKLGQPVPTLSGGEAQRLKLAGFWPRRHEGGKPAKVAKKGHAVPVRRADHRPAFRRHRQTDAGLPQAARGRPSACW